MKNFFPFLSKVSYPFNVILNVLLLGISILIAIFGTALILYIILKIITLKDPLSYPQGYQHSIRKKGNEDGNIDPYLQI